MTPDRIFFYSVVFCAAVGCLAIAANVLVLSAIIVHYLSTGHL